MYYTLWPGKGTVLITQVSSFSLAYMIQRKSKIKMGQNDLSKKDQILKSVSLKSVSLFYVNCLILFPPLSNEVTRIPTSQIVLWILNKIDLVIPPSTS